jgi:hypothetical protein|tara:strand:- start:296 stop:457 length:162 start_codon:yes stop_codon:yes gene_type:complete
MEPSQDDHAFHLFFACGLIGIHHILTDLNLFGLAGLWLASIAAKTKKQSHRQN